MNFTDSVERRSAQTLEITGESASGAIQHVGKERPGMGQLLAQADFCRCKRGWIVRAAEEFRLVDPNLSSLLIEPDVPDGSIQR